MFYARYVVPSMLYYTLGDNQPTNQPGDELPFALRDAYKPGLYIRPPEPAGFCWTTMTTVDATSMYE
jgi:hypothetical protein